MMLSIIDNIMKTRRITPATLNAKSKKIFVQLTKIVPETEKTVHSLTILADLISRFHDCQKSLDEYGIVFVSSQGVPRSNPASAYQLKVVPQIRNLFAELNFYSGEGKSIDRIAEFLGNIKSDRED